MFGGLRVLMLQHQRMGEVAVCACLPRVGAKYFTELGNGFLQISLHGENNAEAVPDLEVAGSGLEQSAILGDGCFELAALGESISQVLAGSGCSANSPATNALRQTVPVIRWSTRNRRSVLATWNSRFTKWCGPACKPKSCTSSMWESQVSGCQLAECPV